MNGVSSGVCGSRRRKLIGAAIVLFVIGGALGAIKVLHVKSQVRDLVMQQVQPEKYTINVMTCRPNEGAFEVPTDAVCTVQLRLSHGGMDAKSINSSSVMLVRTSDQQQVPAVVKLNGDRTITLRPTQPLAEATNYTFILTGGVRHQSGASLIPYATSFTTVNKPDPSIQFEKVTLANAAGTGFTCLRVGPDERLWASSDDGRFFIFPIEADGTLGKPHVITSLHRYNNGPRIVIGFCFDPASTPAYPILWATNCAFTFNNAPDFSGKLTRLAGPDLEDVADVAVHFPRSIRDHMTNQPSIGPDGAIYFPQGSSSSFGSPDEIWGNRIEHEMTATIVRVDRTQMIPGKPVDVLTSDVGGTYDPFAADAPVKVYATGVRNAYDLCWHSNGHLYVPTNGSSAGGHAPAGENAPPVRDISTAEDDWLFKIAPGKFHGHPNPFQGHYVLNGGNPTGGYDFAETFQYPVGTNPDPDYVPPCYSFGKHVSANGVIEYMGDAFGGRLKHKLMVCRYNVGSDIIALGLDAKGDVNSEKFGIAGLSNLVNPLDITEDHRNGNLYISEYGALRITLCRPTGGPSLASPN